MSRLLNHKQNDIMAKPAAAFLMVQIELFAQFELGFNTAIAIIKEANVIKAATRQ